MFVLILLLPKKFLRGQGREGKGEGEGEGKGRGGGKGGVEVPHFIK